MVGHIKNWLKGGDRRFFIRKGGMSERVGTNANWVVVIQKKLFYFNGNHGFNAGSKYFRWELNKIKCL